MSWRQFTPTPHLSVQKHGSSEEVQPTQAPTTYTFEAYKQIQYISNCMQIYNNILSWTNTDSKYRQYYRNRSPANVTQTHKGIYSVTGISPWCSFSYLE